MTTFVQWDGGDAFGVSAQHWSENYPTPGHLLFATDDAGALVLVVQWAPGGGTVPITDANVEAVQAAVLEQLNPAPADDGGGEDVAALTARLDELTTTTTAQQESIDWLAGVVLDLATGSEPTE